MKKLPLTFVGRGEAGGFRFTQIISSPFGYVYKVEMPKCKPHYEVFIKKLNKRFNTISYPGAKSFGIWAWTYRSLKLAMLKFNVLLLEYRSHEK